MLSVGRCYTHCFYVYKVSNIVSSVSIDDIFNYAISEFEGVVISENWGERGLFYNPHGLLPKGIYILTFKEKDGPNDKASNVNRPDIYRINLGLTKDRFKEMFGEIPKRPAAGQTVSTGHDFQNVNEIMPHPVYGWMSWIGVLNPSLETFDALKPMIAEGVQLAKIKYSKKVKL